MADPAVRPSLRVRLLFLAAVMLGVPLASFIVVEGVSSTALFARDLFARAPQAAEQVSTQYDAEIGWVAIPGFRAPNMYGSGVGLTTESHGFRGGDAITAKRPAGRARLICSGDSFTLGYGVSDADTWCALLATPRLQTVNMGQGGYGVDQAYLWYLRDGLPLDHDAQVLAFIDDDFRRMASDRFLTFAKPRMRASGDTIVVENVPVPRSQSGGVGSRLAPAVSGLRLAELFGRLRAPESRAGEAPRQVRGMTPAVRDVMARLVADLARRHRARGSVLALAYLPSETDYVNDASAPTRAAVAQIADSLGVHFVDLVPELRKLSKEEARRVYIQRADVHFVSAKGHFTREGNRWAADALRAALASDVPALAADLAVAGADSGATARSRAAARVPHRASPPKRAPARRRA